MYFTNYPYDNYNVYDQNAYYQSMPLSIENDYGVPYDERQLGQMTPPSFSPPFGQPGGGQFGLPGIFPPFGQPGGGQFGPPSIFPPTGQPGGGQQAGPPTSPPPSFVPQQQVQTFAVDPGGIRRCLFRFTYIWLNNRQQFWFYPVFVGRRSIAGYRWTGFRWVFFGVDLRQIQSFTCV